MSQVNLVSGDGELSAPKGLVLLKLEFIAPLWVRQGVIDQLSQLRFALCKASLPFSPPLKTINAGMLVTPSVMASVCLIRFNIHLGHLRLADIFISQLIDH